MEIYDDADDAGENYEMAVMVIFFANVINYNGNKKKFFSTMGLILRKNEAQNP